jgi:hypothetical protein
MKEEKTMAINQTLNEVQSLLLLVINNYFNGKMPFEVAFAATAMANAYIDSFKGDKSSKFVTQKFEDDQDYLPIILPTDDVIQLQIDNLIGLQKSLKDEDGTRDKWLFWDDQYGPDSHGQQGQNLI